MEVSDKLMIKLLGSSLTGKANTFYMRYVALKQDKWTVDTLITALFDYCFPNNTMELLRRKWDETVQGKKRVLEYARELENLAQKFKEMNERQVVLKFWKGLNGNLRGDMVMQRVNPEWDDLDTVVDEAIQCEKACDERASILRNEKEPWLEASGSRKPKREWTRFKNRSGGTTHYKPREASRTGNKPDKIWANTVSPTNQGPLKDKPQQGYKNNKQYTKDDNKKLSRKQMDTLRAESKCFNCREAGHEQRNCPKLQSMKLPRMVSRIRKLTSKITQVCQDIRDIKLRRLLITRLDSKSNDITNCILTNQNDCKNTLDSSRSRPDPPYTHEGHAEGENNYIYKTPNPLEHDTQNNQEDHGRCPPQLWPTPSGMTPEPLPYPDPSEASETSSLLPTSLSSPPKKDDIEPGASSMYTERPDLSWNLCLAPVKKYGGVEPEEELEMREGTGLRRKGASPCLEFGGGTGTGAARPDRTDSETEPPLLAIASALWQEGQVELWRSIRMAWAGTQCSMIKWLKEAATFSKATNRDSTPSIWEETKAWSDQISWTLFLTNSISGVDPTSSEGWGRLSSA